MPTGHDVLHYPNTVPNSGGDLNVLLARGASQAEMGEAITNDTLVNSIDAEIVANGDSAKGPYRGAISRHGNHTLWGYWGTSSDMTSAGKDLFVNTVYYAAKFHASNAPVLELRLSKTRDSVYDSLYYIRNFSSGYLTTLKNLYLPTSLSSYTVDQVEDWVDENRNYLRMDPTSPRRYYVDEYAKGLGMKNHTRAYLQKLIDNVLTSSTAVEMIEYYTGLGHGSNQSAWQSWYDDNEDYLWFSDSESYKWKIDTEAKSLSIPTATLRNWSSETLNYRTTP